MTTEKELKDVVKKIKDALKNKGFSFIDGGFNLIGIRTNDTEPFSDKFYIIDESNKAPTVSIYSIDSNQLPLGYYSQYWELGSHAGYYESLVNNAGNNIAYNGINNYLLKQLPITLHCQVFANKADFEQAIEKVKQSTLTVFNYALLNETDLQ